MCLLTHQLILVLFISPWWMLVTICRSLCGSFSSFFSRLVCRSDWELRINLLHQRRFLLPQLSGPRGGVFSYASDGAVRKDSRSRKTLKGNISVEDCACFLAKRNAHVAVAEALIHLELFPVLSRYNHNCNVVEILWVKPSTAEKWKEMESFFSMVFYEVWNLCISYSDTSNKNLISTNSLQKWSVLSA